MWVGVVVWGYLRVVSGRREDTDICHDGTSIRYKLCTLGTTYAFWNWIPWCDLTQPVKMCHGFDLLYYKSKPWYIVLDLYTLWACLRLCYMSFKLCM